MAYHKLSSEIIDYLKKGNYWFESFEHEPVVTSEDASRVRPGYVIEQDAKAIIVRVKISESNKKFVMLVLPGNTRVNNQKVKILYGAKDIRFASAEELDTITGGVQSGGVPPLGNFFNLEVVVDPLLLNNEKIVFNAGDRRFSLAMKSADFVTIVNPNISSIIAE